MQINKKKIETLYASYKETQESSRREDPIREFLTASMVCIHTCKSKKACLSKKVKSLAAIEQSCLASETTLGYLVYHRCLKSALKSTGKTSSARNVRNNVTIVKVVYSLKNSNN